MEQATIRFAVQATNATGGTPTGAIPCARSKTRLFNLFLADHYLVRARPSGRAHPAQDLAPSRRWPRPRPTARPCASGAGCSASTITLPACVGKEAATLDLLSDGRWNWHRGRLERGRYTAMGLRLRPPGRRIAKLAEVISSSRPLGRREMDCSGEFRPVHGYAGARGQCSGHIRRS